MWSCITCCEQSLSFIIGNLQGGWCIFQLCQTVYPHSRNLWVVPIWCPLHYRSILIWLLDFWYVRNVHHTHSRQFYILASILGPICQTVCSWSRLCLQSWRMVVSNPWSFGLFWICFHLGFTLLWVMLACVLLSLTFWNRGLPENVAWALIVDARADSDPFHTLKRMVFLQ